MAFSFCVRVALFIWVVLCAAPMAQAAIYYVSRGEGGTPQGKPSYSCEDSKNPTTPQFTISAGIACMQNAGGDAVLIRGGTYPEQIDGGIKSGTSLSNMTMIQAYNQETVILRPTSASSGIRLAATAAAPLRYLIFDGLTIDMQSRTATYGLQFGGAATDIHHHIWRNVEVRNTGYSGVSGFPVDSEMHHSKIHHCGITNAVPQSHGMYICPVRGSFHDNEIYRNGAYGMQVFKGDGCATGLRVFNNRIYENSALNAATYPGGHSAGGMIVGSGDDIQIYNNLFYGNGKVAGAYSGGGITPIGYGTPNTNIKVYHNTFYNNGGNFIFILAGVPHVDIKNNIVWLNDGLLRDDSGNSSPLDSSNLTANPLFTNAAAGDFTPLPNSPAIDTGVPYGGLTTDFNNNTRVGQGGGVDVGAIEVQQSSGGGGTIATYYVAQTGGLDSRSCQNATTASTPLATIAKGLTCLTTGGSTLLIKAGTYPETIDSGTVSIAGGTDYATATTIAAFGNDVVTLQLPSSGVGLFFRDSVNSHYIILDRLIVDGNGTAASNGFACTNGAHHIRFQNGEIKNTGYEPVYISGAANCEILNSTLHDWANLSGVHARGAVSGTVVRGNTISNGPGQGIRIDANEAGTAISGVIIEQNKLHHVGTTSSLAGMVLGGTGNAGLIVRNNVVYASYRGIEIVTGTPSAKILNNTVHGSTTTGIQINAGAVTTQVKNTLSYANSGTAIADASGGMVSATNQITDPSFVDASAGNFQLQSISTAINAGTMLAPDVVYDLVGVSRSEYGAYDIGAYEFTGTVSGGGDVLGPRRTGPAGAGRGMFQLR